ncbi:MAG: hypothetical protein KF715_16260 [Candidatus Didemnitutus sp.]|nr:hypothetical protein [Candidatus Didemnitutus sp.]
MSLPAPLDTYQQVFALSMLSNRASAFTGPAAALQQQLQYELSSYLSGTNLKTVSNGGFVPDTDPLPGLLPGIPTYLGDWTLEWGPVVFSHTRKDGKPTGVADNAVFVASCPAVTFPGCPNTNQSNQPTGTLTTYVVAIAATNPTSIYDWTVEDFDVSSSVPWNGWTPGNLTPASKPVGLTTPVISMGTAIGVSTVLSLTPPAAAPGSGQTLPQFLSQLKPGPNSAIVFTGHSLAGALSPTTAFQLQRSGALSGFAYNLVYPTAGATPGNLPFVSAFNTAFPSPPKDPATGATWQIPAGAPYQCWNTLLWNRYDVVPHAWYAFFGGSPKLSEIPTLYGSPALSSVSDLATGAAANSAFSTAIYAHTRNAPLPGTLQPGVMLGSSYVSTPTPPTAFEQFLAQLYVQHIGMYSGIPANPPQIPNATPGVILPSPVPHPSPALPRLPGVSTLELDLEAFAQRILTQIEDWLKKHHLP